MSNPKGGNPSALYQNPATISLFEKRYVFLRIRAYLRYVEPEGGKPSAVYQNPGTMSLFEKKTITPASNPKQIMGFGIVVICMKMVIFAELEDNDNDRWPF